MLQMRRPSGIAAPEPEETDAEALLGGGKSIYAGGGGGLASPMAAQGGAMLALLRSRLTWLSAAATAVALVLAAAATLLVFHSLFSLDLPRGLPISQFDGDGISSDAATIFTVRMNTFRRNDDLKRSVDNYALCPAVTRIQIVWSDQENEPPPLKFFSPAARELIEFELHTTDSLNNRFNALSPPPTEAVFSVDDDMLFKCEDLKFAHQTWRAASETMVGFVPRLVTRDEETGEHRYRSWWFTWWNGAYNLVLTKAAFLHRKHLHAYMTLPPEILAYIDAHRNCEDIAMSMVVARDTRAPPLWVRGAIRELGAPGISSSGGHYRARCACLDAFAQVLGGTHLQLGTAKAVPSRGRWLWT